MRISCIVLCMFQIVTAITTMGFFTYTNEYAISAPGVIDLDSGNITWGERINYVPGYVACNIITIGTNYVITSATGLLLLAENGTIIDTLQLDYYIVTMSSHPGNGLIYAIGIPYGTTATKTTLLCIDLQNHNVNVLVEQVSSASGVLPCASTVDFNDVFTFVIQEAAILQQVVAYNIRQNTSVGMFYSGWIESLASAPIDNDMLVWVGVSGKPDYIVSMDPRYNKSQLIVEFNQTGLKPGSLYTIQQMQQPIYLGYTLIMPNILVGFAQNIYKTLLLDLSGVVGIVGIV